MRHEAAVRTTILGVRTPLHMYITGLRPDGSPIYAISGGATGTAFSDFLEQKVLEHCFRNIAYAQPTTTYSALFTVTPGETGGGTEVTGGSYARKAITFGAYSGASQITNSVLNDFGTASANWGTIVAAAIFDAATVGNMMAYGALVANKTVNNGDGFSFAIGKLTVALD
jgi:hypothetical protein